jgi:hypothetical protein
MLIVGREHAMCLIYKTITTSKREYCVDKLPQLTRRVSCKYLLGQMKAKGNPKLYVELHVI